jgi:putative transposase
LIEPHGAISVKRQCDLVGLARSSWYYEPVREREADLQLKRWIDEQYTRTPFYGVRRMTVWLQTEKHAHVNRKRVGRLMREMGLEAIYPKPRLSRPGDGRLIYPYLLRGLPIVRPNQVWGADITYIRLAQGFVYLVAILDWFSRYVVSWAVSVTMDVAFCVEALAAALQEGRPEIFNTDQGSQFTSADFTGRLKAAEIRISMDGRGRVFDNIFVERLWRTVKYEEVYLKDYTGVPTAVESLGRYFRFYNTERFHQSLGYKTPEAAHRGL